MDLWPNSNLENPQLFKEESLTVKVKRWSAEGDHTSNAVNQAVILLVGADN